MPPGATSGVQALQGLYAQVATRVSVPAEQADQGLPADPRHGTDQGGTYPWIDSPYQAAGNSPIGLSEYAYTGLEDPYGFWVSPAGRVDPDQSPAMHSHAAPYPPAPSAGNIGDGAEQWAAQEIRAVGHGNDQGSVRINTSTPGFGEEHDTWHNQYHNDPGQTDLTPNVPAQLRGGPAGRDSTQGFGTDNKYGFGAPHYQRYVSTGANGEDGISVPGNYQWLNAAERPLIVPQRGLQATFDQGDSPYGTSGDTHGYMMLGPSQAAVMTNPTAYVQPAAPNVDPGYSGSWGWAW
jgi:hypothetical protein